MSFADVAGLAGMGFVLVAVAINVVYIRAGLPLPGSHQGLDAATRAFAVVGDGLRKPSVAAPVSWLCTTVFAAGLLAVLWRDGSAGSASVGSAGWALVGFAGVLMQNVTFTCVEALRFGMAAAAAHGGNVMAGLWALSNVLFGLNQCFLATALVGFTAAGTGAGLFPHWLAGLGYGSAALLFLSASAAPYRASGGNRFAAVGLIGWFGWVCWIIVCSVTLLGR